MKNVLYLMSIALLILFGCAQEDSHLSDLSVDNQNDEENITVLVNDDVSEYWKTFTLGEWNGTTGLDAARGNSAHTHGEFTTSNDPLAFSTFEFSGTENNGGAHGSAEIFQTRGGLTRHFIMETACVAVIDNEAVYGGIITEVIENSIPNPPPPPPPPPCPTFPNCPPPPPPCDFYDVGTYFYFRVIDNGQGNNAPADQFVGVSIASCAFASNCLETFPWFIFSVNDVANESDHIKVNN